MTRLSMLALAVAALTLASCGPRAASPVRLSQAEADSLLESYRADRERTLGWLQSAPSSYLATVQRVDFGERPSLTVGRAEGSEVRIDDPSVAASHLRVTVVGDSFWVEALDPRAVFAAGKDSSMREGRLPPSAIGVGRFRIRLSHQRFPALIVFDPQSPRFADYRGMRWFAPDLAYRYVLPLTPNPSPDTVLILSTRGNTRRAVRAGWFDFMVGNTRCRLEASRLLEPGVGENDLSVFFSDRTSGDETYGIGRYVDPAPTPDGRFVLDFNNAYSPACAYSDHYNCPIPPKANALRVAIRAGEMDSHYLEH